MGKWVHRLSNRDLEAKTADCLECGPNVRIKVRPGGKSSCFKGDKLGSWKLVFGLTEEKKQWFSDHFFCEVCGTDQDLCIDHDHNCCPRNQGCMKCIRGILCNQCNFAEGNLRSDAGIALMMYQYILRHSQEKD